MQSKRVKNLNPYKPGEQPKDKPYIKLNANENPYPPSPEVLNAIKNKITNEKMLLALYPDPDSNELKKAIAELLNSTGGVLCRTHVDEKGNCTPNEQDKIPFEITPDMIFVGNGSDEVLSFVFYSFFDKDRTVVQAEHSYSFYPVYAQFYELPLLKVPLTPSWEIDSEKILNTAASTGNIILANPNAPTGIALKREQIKELLKNAPKNYVHVIDEAYVDFGGESCLSLLNEFDNLIIVRTFSKSLSFAGQRLGFAIANPKLIQTMTCVKDSFNHFPVDAIAQTAGIATCKNAAYYVDCAKKIVKERNDFSSFLQNLNWKVLPSSTNFVFATKEGFSGKETYEHIKNQGILVRHFNTSGIENFVRVTIGTTEQMKKLKNIWPQNN